MSEETPPATNPGHVPSHQAAKPQAPAQKPSAPAAAKPPAPAAEPSAEPSEPLDAKAILRSVVTGQEMTKKYSLKGKTIRRAVKKGALPTRKAGKIVLMRRDDARALWGKKGDPKAQQAAGPQHQALEEVVLVEEAAEALGMKKKQLRKAAKSEKLAMRKAGKHWLMRRADVQNLRTS